MKFDLRMLLVSKGFFCVVDYPLSESQCSSYEDYINPYLEIRPITTPFVAWIVAVTYPKFVFDVNHN